MAAIPGKEKSKKNGPVISVVGNPNCGKTTLFNGLTGGKQRIGNWPGVTVEMKEGTIKTDNGDITLVDLPGIYSLSVHSEDEKVARDYILSGESDVVVNIIDSTNLERNLFLTTQLLEMKVPLLIVLNMVDMAHKENIKIDVEHLAKHLQVPVIPITATKKDDIIKVKSAITKAIETKKAPDVSITYPDEIEQVITGWQKPVASLAQSIGTTPRWVALKLLEEDNWVTNKVVNNTALTNEVIYNEIGKIESIMDDSADIILADYRYGFIHGITSDVVKKQKDRVKLTDKIDRIVLNRFLGLPLFLGVMYLLFWFTITIGGAFIDFFDILFGTIFVDGFSFLLESVGTPQWIVSILAGGIGAGVQTVATFIPIIFTMFFALSILEDSGYMARAAFVVDRFMRLIGLPGKSFVPMLVGFGCTVPGVMATRTLENKKDRYLTIFMTPFMSCGARLPVYVLFAAAFFPRSSGLMVFSLYLTGIIIAVLTGLLLKNTLFKGETSHFIMELPPYHMPRIKHILIHTWNRLKIFVIRAGVVITIIVTILAFLNSLGTDFTFGNEDNEKSVLSTIGKSITPIFEPMGIEKDNWPATVGIFTGIFAKEAVVGTLSSLYSQIDASGTPAGEEEVAEFDFFGGIQEAFGTIPANLSGVFGGLADPFGLGILSSADDQEAIAEEIEADKGIFAHMQSFFSKGAWQAYAYLLFVLLYFPCVAAFGSVVREIGPKMAWLLAGYVTVLGWIVATLFYQITTGFSLLWILFALFLLLLLVLGFYLAGNKIKARLNEEGSLKKAIVSQEK